MSACRILEQLHVGSAQFLHRIVGILGIEKENQLIRISMIEPCWRFRLPIVNIVISNGIDESLIGAVVELFFERIVEDVAETFVDCHVNAVLCDLRRVLIGEIVCGRFIQLIYSVIR